MTTTSIDSIKITNNDKKLVFNINNVDVAYVNALRRVILSEIPNIAIAYDPYKPDESDILFKKNTSVLHNEFVGHRISLLPLHLSKEEIANFDPNNYKFQISVKNKTNSLLEITTDDIKAINNSTVNVKEVFPHDPITNEPILITKLKPNIKNPDDGEELVVEFTARRGIAKQHSRWCPVSTCTYFNILDDDLIEKAMKNIDSKALHSFNTIDKYRIFKKNVYGDANCFTFTIESECKLKAKDILDVAFEVIERKIESLKDTSKYDIKPLISENNNMYMISIHDEDHTLGNVLQTYIYNKYVRENKKEMISYVGYYQPHPLENTVVVKIQFTDDKKDVFEILRQIFNELAQEFKNISAIWKKNNKSK